MANTSIAIPVGIRGGNVGLLTQREGLREETTRPLGTFPNSEWQGDEAPRGRRYHGFKAVTSFDAKEFTQNICNPGWDSPPLASTNARTDANRYNGLPQEEARSANARLKRRKTGRFGS